MQPLNLGLVGCGDIAGYTALLSKLVPRVRLVACCDINRKRAEQFARRFRIPMVFTDYDELLSQSNLDAVYLAVPHHLHAPMVKKAAAASKHVWVEKPLTRTYPEGIELYSTVQDNGVKVGVNYQYRYDPGCYRLVQAVQHGYLGDVFHVRINVPWSRQETYFSGAAWHASFEQSGGGTLLTQGSHFLDVAMWALKQRPISTEGITRQVKFKDVEVEDQALGLVTFEKGTTLQIHSTMTAAVEGAVSIEFYGEKGTALYSNRPYPNVRFLGVKPPAFRLSRFGVHALQRSLSGFCDWVKNDIPYLTPIDQALPVLAVVDAIYQSALSEEKVKISDLTF